MLSCSTDSYDLNRFTKYPKIVIPLFLLSLFIIFEFTFTLGNLISTYLDSFFLVVYNLLKIESTFIKIIYSGITGILVFLPSIAILYFFLFLLKDSGVLSRVSEVFDKYLIKFGLGGQSFMSLFMGFGCTVPAILSTKEIENKRERLLAIMTLPFITCSAKVPILVLFTSLFIPAEFQSLGLSALYFISILVALLSNYLLSKILKKEKKYRQITHPKYNLPKISSLVKKSYLVIKAFIKKIGLYILPFSILLGVLFSFPGDAELSKTYGSEIGKSLHTIFKPLGFSEEMSISIFTGIVGKEVIASTFSSLSTINGSTDQISFLSAFSFSLFILLSTSCLGSIITVLREYGKKYMLFFIFYPLFLAWGVSYLTYNGSIKIFSSLL